MTRVAVWALGTRGDVVPYCALADALARRGIRPLIVTSEAQRGLAEASGHETWSIGTDPSMLLMTDHPHALGGAGGRLDQLRATADYLRDARSVYRAVARRALHGIAPAVQAHIVTLASVWLYPLLVEAAGGGRVAGAFLQPITFSRRYRPTVLPTRGAVRALPARLAHVLADLLTWLPWRGALTPVADAAGLLVPFAGPLHLLHRNRATVVYGFSNTLVPARFVSRRNHHVTGAWGVRTGADAEPPSESLPANVSDFIDRHGAPILVSFGSQSRSYRALLERIIRHPDPPLSLIVQGHGVVMPNVAPRSDRVLLLTDAALDHVAILPRCRGMVHHGGAGTLHTAVASGTPSLVVPLSSDTHFWRARAVAGGVAPPARVTSDTPLPEIDLALRQLAQPPYARRADELARRMAHEPGVDRAAALLDESLEP